MLDTWTRRGIAMLTAVSATGPHWLVVPLMAMWAGVVCARHTRASTRTITRRVDGLVLATLIWLLTALASLAVVPSGPQGLRLVAWFGLAVLVASATRSLPAAAYPEKALGAGAAWGASLAGLFAVVEVGLLGERRADAFTGNAIVFGTVALVLGAVAWWLAPQRHHAVAGVVGAVVASVLSGSRGTWLAVPLIGALAVIDHRRRRGGLPWVRVAAVSVAVVTGAVVLGGGMPVQRLSAAVDDVTAYVGAEAPEPATGTSIGARFEAWRAAGSAFVDRPLLGVGWGNLAEVFDQQVADGRRHPRIATFTHAHHHLLGALASGGVAGLAASGAVLVIPAWWFRRAWRSGDTTARSLGGLGLAVVGTYVIVGQSEAIFDDGLAVGVYALVAGTALRYLDQLDDHGRVDTPASAVPASPE